MRYVISGKSLHFLEPQFTSQEIKATDNTESLSYKVVMTIKWKTISQSEQFYISTA